MYPLYLPALTENKVGVLLMFFDVRARARVCVCVCVCVCQWEQENLCQWGSLFSFGLLLVTSIIVPHASVRSTVAIIVGCS